MKQLVLECGDVVLYEHMTREQWENLYCRKHEGWYRVDPDSTARVGATAAEQPSGVGQSTPQRSKGLRRSTDTWPKWA